jgi:hypothetical protein
MNNTEEMRRMSTGTHRNERDSTSKSEPYHPNGTSTNKTMNNQNINPYKRPAEACTGNETGSSRYTQNTIERQHPHRAGTIRIDKEFQVSLQVSINTDDDTSTSSDDSGIHRQKMTSVRGTGRIHNRSCKSPKERRTGKKYRDEDDDDDDRELLDYAPFTKTPKRS